MTNESEKPNESKQSNETDKIGEVVNKVGAEISKSPKTLAFVVYILQIVALMNGITAIIGVVISYVKVDDASEPDWIRSHYRWQIKTFWMALILSIVGFITIFIIIGYFILLFTTIWFIYRVVKGLIRLNDNQAIG